MGEEKSALGRQEGAQHAAQCPGLHPADRRSGSRSGLLSAGAQAAEQEIQIWEESEISQFFVSILGHRLEALYHLAITTGMRQMELLGLKWEDLDWEKQAIEIKRTTPEAGEWRVLRSA